MTDLAALVVRLEADASVYLKALDQATAKLNKFHKDQQDALSQIGDKLKEFGTTVVAAFAVEKMVEFASQAIESAAQLDKLSQITGIGVQALAGLNLAFTAAGLSSDETGVSMKKLNVAISDAAGSATSKAGAAFRTMGINVREANGAIKDAGTVNAEVADYFASTADGANKVALAVALYGKAGQAMIPVLNEGAKGLAEYQKQAEEWGLTISNDAARAAEDFEKKIRSLRAELTGSLGAQLAQDLLPVLNSLVASFTAGGNAGAALGEIAKGLTFAFEAIATVVIVVVGQFKSWLEVMGGIANAFKDLATAPWGEKIGRIGDDLAQGFDKAGTTIGRSAGAIRDMWVDFNEIQVTAKKIKDDAGSLKGTEEQDKSVAKLKAFSDGLKAQAATFGLGEAALVKYDLAVGKYAEDVKLAGEEGKKFATDAVKAADALQFKKDEKSGLALVRSLIQQTDTLNASAKAAFEYKINSGELGEALDRLAKSGHDLRPALEAAFDKKLVAEDQTAIQQLNDEIDKTNGKLVQAGVAAFDLQHKALSDNVQATGSVAGQQAIAQRRAQLEFIDQYNEQVARATQLEKGLADAEGAINVQRAQGQITEFEAQQRIDALRKQEITDLNGVLAAEQRIAQDSGIPELTTKTLAFSASIDQLKTQTDILEKSVRDNLEKSFANNFEDLITGAKSFRDALKGFLKDIEKMFLDQISKNYAQQLFGTGGAAGSAPGFLAGLMNGASGSGGSASGLAGIMSLFGGGGSSAGLGNSGSPSGSAISGLTSGIGTINVGALEGFASGGTIPKGSFGMVGENGPELAYAGSNDMHIQPMSSANKAVNVTNHFTVQSQNGQISRQSQSQVAAAAARSLGQASARNNR